MIFKRKDKTKSKIVRKKYKKGDIIIEEGSDIDEAYILYSGRVEVSRNVDGDKINLATLKPGDIFGEIGLTEKRTRTTTVAAIEDVEVDVLNMNNLDEIVMSNPERIIPVLRMLFERIRTLNAMLTTQQQKTPGPRDAYSANWKITMTGITPEAQKALNGDSLLIEALPFRIGRQSSESNLLSYNDLTLQDKVPYHASRNHLTIMRTAKGIGIVDRGSTLGTIVNGHQIGGRAPDKRVLLEEGENEIIVGTVDSPYKFNIMLERD